MNKYKVIWFDDEFDTLNIIKEKALLNGIQLFGFNNAKDGVEELEKNFLSYDAAIVDGKFYQKPGQTGDATDDNALLDVARSLERLSTKKKLPWFILSGQISFTKEKNRYADGFKNNKVYDKLSEKDLISLWDDLKNEADQQIETQIRNNYSKVFEVFTETYLGTTASIDLLNILKRENEIFAYNDPILYFNPLRKIMEDFFKACNKWGLLPDVFIKGNVALNESSKFLSGSVEKGYQYSSSILPKVVGDNLKNILAVCQPAAHRSEIDSFVSKVNSPYLLLSITYQVLDVILWFKIYIDENNNIEINKSKYKSINSEFENALIFGVIEQDNSRNYHCGEFVITYKHFKDNGYNVNDEIRILKSASNTNEKTKHLYSKSIINSERNH